MSSLTRGLRQRLRSVLADGEWHSMVELLKACDGLIRPEVAFRSGSKALKNSYRADYIVLIGKVRTIRLDLCKIGVDSEGQGLTARFRLKEERRLEDRTDNSLAAAARGLGRLGRTGGEHREVRTDSPDSD